MPKIAVAPAQRLVDIAIFGPDRTAVQTAAGATTKLKLKVFGLATARKIARFAAAA